jgi:predicted transcriptional regulator
VDIDTSFFSLFRQMFKQGTVAKIGVYAWAVYTCIKSHADFNDGLSFPTRKQLSEETGLSERQVQRSLKVLEKEGLLTKSKDWNRNVYRIKEKLTDKQTVITWDHLPAALKKARQELQNFLLTYRQFQGRQDNPRRAPYHKRGSRRPAYNQRPI